MDAREQARDDEIEAAIRGVLSAVNLRRCSKAARARAIEAAWLEVAKLTAEDRAAAMHEILGALLQACPEHRRNVAAAICARVLAPFEANGGKDV